MYIYKPPGTSVELSIKKLGKLINKLSKENNNYFKE